MQYFKYPVFDPKKWLVWNRQRRDNLSGHELVITSYGMVSDTSFKNVDWGVTVFDEAQAFKNDYTKIAKRLSGNSISRGFRIAMTGTPIENSLTDIHSIFTCLHSKPWVDQFMGSAKEFEQWKPEDVKKQLKDWVMQRDQLDEGTDCR